MSQREYVANDCLAHFESGFNCQQVEIMTLKEAKQSAENIINRLRLENTQLNEMLTQQREENTKLNEKVNQKGERIKVINDALIRASFQVAEQREEIAKLNDKVNHEEEKMTEFNDAVNGVPPQVAQRHLLRVSDSLTSESQRYENMKTKVDEPSTLKNDGKFYTSFVNFNVGQQTKSK